MAAGDEVRAPRQTSERAAREALKASTLRGFELCLRRRGLICHALKSAALKEGLSFILPPSRGGTPSLKTTSRHLSDHETRLPRERLHLRLSPVGAPGGAQWDVSGGDRAPFVCLHGPRLRRHRSEAQSRQRAREVGGVKLQPSPSSAAPELTFQ